MSKQISVAIAILYRQNQFLMQLRDNIPGILYPGHWGLFGGHIEPGELPDAAIIRELQEEINYTPPKISKFSCYSDTRVIRHVYHVPLTVDLDQLVLREGWDLSLLIPQQILQGECYSEKAQAIKPLGTPHQKILLDFIKLKLYS